MHGTSSGDTGEVSRPSRARLALHVSGYGALWAILGEGGGWPVGVPVILIAAAVSLRGTATNRWSLAGLARFIPFFLWNSLRGAVDVAARALHPGLPIDPAVLQYEMRLDSTVARVLMANTVTLLPGTLSADLSGNVLTVHVLNASSPVTEVLDTLERRIAGLVRRDSAVSA